MNKSRKKARKGVNTSIDFEITDPKIRIVASVFFILFLLFIITYPLVSLLGTTSPIRTQTAVTRTVYETIDVKAFVIRKEQVIDHMYSGTIVPAVNNGSKVAIGDVVANIYSDETKAGYAERLTELSAEIEYYRTVAMNSQITQQADIDVYKDIVNDIVFNLSENIERDSLSSVYSLSRQLREAITKKQMGTGITIDVTPKIQELQREYDSIKGLAVPSSSVSVEKSGFYVNNADGYENAVDFETAQSLTPDEIKRLLSSEETGVSQHNVGKLITDFNWYLVCTASMEELAGKTKGSFVTVSFSDSQVDDIRMKIEAVNTVDGSDEVALILSSNLMNEHIAGLRNVTVKIRVSSVSGLAVDRMALRTVDGEKGVYVKIGNLVEFKKVQIVHSDDNIILSGDDGKTSGLLEMYDEVILEGVDLYESKLLN